MPTLWQALGDPTNRAATAVDGRLVAVHVAGRALSVVDLVPEVGDRLPLYSVCQKFLRDSMCCEAPQRNAIAPRVSCVGAVPRNSYLVERYL